LMIERVRSSAMGNFSGQAGSKRSVSRPEDNRKTRAETRV
jgi:hypothetical protein